MLRGYGEMQSKTIRLARKKRGWTETEAAQRLGVSQSYLAMLEGGQRRVTTRLARKLRTVYGLGPTSLPTPDLFHPPAIVNNEELAKVVSALGYPGFAYMKARTRKRNPAEVLVEALNQESLEPRVVEALPWLVMHYWDMDKDWLVRNAKVNDLQNRLGFVVTLARRVSERSDNEDRNRALEELEKSLNESRLVREDTFLKSVNSEVEREWLRRNRPEEARHWNLLTNWRPEHLQYAFQK
jgi:transcriptional regulator with XRE-family HTH domain